jgi:hypothetical protein
MMSETRLPQRHEQRNVDKLLLRLSESLQDLAKALKFSLHSLEVGVQFVPLGDG